MTPFEFSLCVEKHAADRKEAQQNIMTQAWLNANFVWMAANKKLPKLDKLLKGLDEKPKKQPKISAVDELIEIAKRKNLKGPW